MELEADYCEHTEFVNDVYLDNSGNQSPQKNPWYTFNIDAYEELFNHEKGLKTIIVWENVDVREITNISKYLLTHIKENNYEIARIILEEKDIYLDLNPINGYNFENSKEVEELKRRKISLIDKSILEDIMNCLEENGYDYSF
jgi:hypothetical protein